jgi:methionine biosynthesis protein MetW
MATLESTSSRVVPGILGRHDYKIIGELVEPNSKVLDLGCGGGELLDWLVENKNVQARGVEIASELVRKCVARGLSVFQGDINQGLADYPDQCFDYVILSQTMQETYRPRDVLEEMGRVAKHMIVAFPNFARWSVPFSLMVSGRAPKTRHLPYEWYDSPNTHFVTIIDFEETLQKLGFKIERSYFLLHGRRVSVLPNLRAEISVYLLTSHRTTSTVSGS